MFLGTLLVLLAWETSLGETHVLIKEFSIPVIQPTSEKKETKHPG